MRPELRYIGSGLKKVDARKVAGAVMVAQEAGLDTDGLLDAQAPGSPLSQPRTKTIAQQIADHVAAAIVRGEYRDGDRLRETELASMYGVSRGPVREAIRELEKHGLAVTRPRRGALAVGISLDFIAEVFNIRAALGALAVRYCVRRQPEHEIAELGAKVAALTEAAEDERVDAFRFAERVRECAWTIYRSAQAPLVERTLHTQYAGTIWGLMWRAQPLNYLDFPRRRAAARDWTVIHAAIAAGDETAAAAAFLRDVRNSRNSVLATLAAIRGVEVEADTALLLDA